MKSGTTPSPRLLRRVLTTLAALLPVSAGTSWRTSPASSASAAVIDAECLGGFGRVFSPPITFIPQTATTTATYT